MEGYSDALALFYEPAKENGIDSLHWIDMGTVSQIYDSSVIDFLIPGNSQYYIDLKKIRLHVKCKIVKNDGKIISKDEDVVTPVNNFLHSLCEQVQVTVGQKAISSGIARNYPYKSIIDILLNSTSDKQSTILSNQMFYKDTESAMEQTKIDEAPINSGLILRNTATNSNGIFEMEGPLNIDFFCQSRFLLNGVPISIKLFQSSDAFRLLSDKNIYKVKITEAIMRVCYVKVSPGILIGHAEALKEEPAKYYFNDSEIKTYEIGKGQYSYIADNLFHGLIPSELVITLASAQAINGSFQKNPFNFKHYNVNLCSLYVDGQAIHPYHTDYMAGNFADAYHSLFQKNPSLRKSEYRNGYTFYIYDLKKHKSGLLHEKLHGQTRIEIRFSNPLPETATLILYAKFPTVLKINETRQVCIE